MVSVLCVEIERQHWIARSRAAILDLLYQCQTSWFNSSFLWNSKELGTLLPHLLWHVGVELMTLWMRVEWSNQWVILAKTSLTKNYKAYDLQVMLVTQNLTQVKWNKLDEFELSQRQVTIVFATIHVSQYCSEYFFKTKLFTMLER